MVHDAIAMNVMGIDVNAHIRGKVKRDTRGRGGEIVITFLPSFTEDIRRQPPTTLHHGAHSNFASARTRR